MLVYRVDPENEECKTAYPNLLFGRDIIDGRGAMCSVVTLTVGNNQGMGDGEFGKIYDVYFPPEFLRLSMAPPAASWTSRTWASAPHGLRGVRRCAGVPR